MAKKKPEQEYTVYATLTLRGATMTVTAKDEDDARRQVDAMPAFDMSGAELTDWSITRVRASN